MAAVPTVTEEAKTRDLHYLVGEHEEAIKNRVLKPLIFDGLGPSPSPIKDNFNV